MLIGRALSRVFIAGLNLLKDIFSLILARRSTNMFKPVAIIRLNIIVHVMAVFVAMIHEPIITSRNNPNPGETSAYKYGFLKESGVIKANMPKPRYDKIT